MGGMTKRTKLIDKDKNVYCIDIEYPQSLNMYGLGDFIKSTCLCVNVALLLQKVDVEFIQEIGLIRIVYIGEENLAAKMFADNIQELIREYGNFDRMINVMKTNIVEQFSF